MVTTYYAPDKAVKSVLLELRGTNLNGGDQTVFIDRIEVLALSGSVTDAGLVNADLSYPPNGPGYYAYLYGNHDPLLGWTFGGSSGITTNNGPFGGPSSPNGIAFMFIQGATITSQTMQLKAGRYRLRFLAARRFDTQPNTLDVRVGGVNVLTDFTPRPYEGFQTYLTDYFTV